MTQEELAAALAAFRTDILGGIPEEVQRAAAALSNRPQPEMLFGREKKGIKDLSGTELVGQWFLAKIMAQKEPWNAPRHYARAAALSRHSWSRVTDPQYAATVEKALTVAAEGTDLTPVEFIAQMIEKAPEISELVPFVMRKNVVSDTGTQPKEGAAVTVQWDTGENTAATETDPAYTQIAYSIHKAALFTLVSNELMEDSPLSVVADVSRQFTNAMLKEMDKVVAIGDGSTQPLGIASATITQSVALSNSITYDGLVSILKKLPRKYRANARWIGKGTVLDEITALVDNDGAPIFKESPVNGQPGKVLGHSLSAQDDLPSTDLWIGDLSFYTLFDRNRITFSSDAGGKYFEQGVRALKMEGRLDGKVALEEAFARGKSITGV